MATSSIKNLRIVGGQGQEPNLLFLAGSFEERLKKLKIILGRSIAAGVPELLNELIKRKHDVSIGETGQQRLRVGAPGSILIP